MISAHDVHALEFKKGATQYCYRIETNHSKQFVSMCLFNVGLEPQLNG